MIHLLSHSQGKLFVERTLLHFGMEKSWTQPHTMADGNCAIYALIDQISRIHRLKNFADPGRTLRERAFIFREKITPTLKEEILNGRILWVENSIGTPNQWMEKMKQNGEYIDQHFLQLVSNTLNVNIAIIQIQDCFEIISR